jgi:hypothetical protein
VTEDPTDTPDDLGPTMLVVSSQPAGGPMLLLPVLGGLALLMLVVGPLLIWFSGTNRGPQWLRR